MDYWSEKILILLELAKGRRLHITDLRQHLFAQTGLRDPRKFEFRLKCLHRDGYIEITGATIYRTAKPLPQAVVWSLELTQREAKYYGGS